MKINTGPLPPNVTALTLVLTGASTTLLSYLRVAECSQDRLDTSLHPLGEERKLEQEIKTQTKKKNVANSILSAVDIKVTIALLLSFNLIFRKVSKAPSAGYRGGARRFFSPSGSLEFSWGLAGKIPSLCERCPNVQRRPSCTIERLL